jgi:hypothetical protein
VVQNLLLRDADLSAVVIARTIGVVGPLIVVVRRCYLAAKRGLSDHVVSSVLKLVHPLVYESVLCVGLGLMVFQVCALNLYTLKSGRVSLLLLRCADEASWARVSSHV